MGSENRYAQDWNTYSTWWQTEYAGRYKHLGDEWNDDHTANRRRDEFYFTVYADRWLSPEMTVLEVGPGGGKWTVRIAPRVKRVIVLDVADEMLKRTRERCASHEIENVEFLLGNGRDFQPVADASIDFFFSYDVFVHIALEDTWPYTQELARVLKPGGRGACHHAVNSVPDAWDRIEQQNDWYRGGRHTIGQFYYHSPEALRRLYERCGLLVLEQHQEGWHCTSIFEKLARSIVPQLEACLRQLISPEADDAHYRARVIRELRGLPDQVRTALDTLLGTAQQENDCHKRLHVAAEIRRLLRGC